jgi:hypothetical protein
MVVTTMATTGFEKWVRKGSCAPVELELTDGVARERRDRSES